MKRTEQLIEIIIHEREWEPWETKIIVISKSLDLATLNRLWRKRSSIRVKYDNCAEWLKAEYGAREPTRDEYLFVPFDQPPKDFRT